MAQRTPNNSDRYYDDYSDRPVRRSSSAASSGQGRTAGTRSSSSGGTAGTSGVSRSAASSRTAGTSRTSSPYRTSGTSGTSRSTRTASGMTRASAGDREYTESRSRSANSGRNAGSRNNRRRKKKKSSGGLIALLIIMVIIIAGAVFVLKSGILTSTPEIHEVLNPYPEKPRVVSTATVGASGDILLHKPILNTVEWKGYDFTDCFSGVKYYYEQPDLMLVNLEVPLGGEEYGYSSFPSFNSPDTIADALKYAGVDMCLTANNHSNDMGYAGMMRTLDVLDADGIEHLGTRENADEHYLSVKMINGIKIGMVCYTYDTREYTDGELSLNFNVLSDNGAASVKTFNYNYLDEFYADVEEQLYYMDMLGCEANIFFLHWGQEYLDDPNYIQTEIAQHLCDMGVDVIIGGHPHVIEAFDVLESADGHQMVCLYSMGNELSNQRISEMMEEDHGRGYTEDGLIIEVTFEKFNNGKVKVGAVDITPTWVQLDDYGYKIIALDQSEDPWSWGTSDMYSAIASYNRTLGRLGDAYIKYRASKGQGAVLEYIE